MTRSLLILAIGVLTFAVGLQQFFHRHSLPGSDTSAAPSRHVPVRSPVVTGRARRTVRITVDGLNFAFKPSTITVAPGTVITWVNETASPHTVTSVTPRLFDASIKGHSAIRIAFYQPGTYQYYCALHPYMLGVIQVRK